MTTQQHGFKAEVQQLLDLMIHAVYSNRDVFLRELVSNAADALDKARFLALTEGELVPAAGEPGVRVTVDKEARTLTLEDDGVGMSVDEAVQNLGTIAHSGSRAFFEQLKAAGKTDVPELIGRFGVGFYSCFMVADEVTVESQSIHRHQGGVRWCSSGAGSYTVEEHDRMHRGTRIVLKLREDAEEYLDVFKLRQIIQQHSNFLSWPILVDGQQANSGKALWAEPPSSVTDEAANELYKSLCFDWEDPLLRVHLTTESPLQIAAMLFVPRSRPYDLFHPEAEKGPRLYARRVLIDEHAKDVLPDWLRFLRGVVDSEDIPLNVSREMVQKTPAVRKIREVLTKRVLKELRRFAEREGAEGEPHPYERLWDTFGVLLKEGYYQDKGAFGEELLPLLRFRTTADEALWSLSACKAAMGEGQDAIWYLTGETREAALASPHLEAFRKKGWNVLLLTDAVDEWFVQALGEYEGVPVKSVARGELKLDDEGEGERVSLEGLAPWMSGLLAGEVAGVRESTRLTDSPAVLVDDEHGISGNMERLLRAARQDVPAARRHLELNTRHPLIRDLARLHEAGKREVAEPLARLLLDDALLLEGTVKEPISVGRRLQALLQQAAASALEGAAS